MVVAFGLIITGRANNPPNFLEYGRQAMTRKEFDKLMTTEPGGVIEKESTLRFAPTLNYLVYAYFVGLGIRDEKAEKWRDAYMAALWEKVK